MCLLKQNLSYKLVVKRKIKYLIVASTDGIVYGAFAPGEKERATKYVKKLCKKNVSSDIRVYAVSNLNRFFADLKYGKRSKLPIGTVCDEPLQYRLVAK